MARAQNVSCTTKLGKFIRTNVNRELPSQRQSVVTTFVLLSFLNWALNQLKCFSIKFQCNEMQGLIVIVSDQTVKCSYKDQIVEFRITTNSQNKNMAVYFGNIICPSCEEICKVKLNHIN